MSYFKEKLQNVYVFHYSLLLNVCYFVKFLENTIEIYIKNILRQRCFKDPKKCLKMKMCDTGINPFLNGGKNSY